jgi:tetratricopeptide (TPR) repeat protein
MYRRILLLLSLIVLIVLAVIGSRLAGYHSMAEVKTLFEDLSAILWSMAQIILVLLLFAMSLILFRWMSSRSGTTILAFENATGQEKYDGRGIADSLVAELHRIRQIHASTYEGVQSETLMIRLMPPTAESLGRDLSEVGTVGFGETKVSIGKLLMSLKRLWPFGDPGSVITGSVQKYGPMVRIVARMEYHEITAWEVSRKLEHDDELPELIRDLAYQVVRDVSPNVAAKTSAGLKHFSEALENYRSFKQTGVEADLESARIHTLAASKAEQGYKTLFRLLYNLAGAFYDKNEYIKSEELYRTANAITSDKDALNGQGASLSLMGRTEEADRIYKQAIALDPKYAQSYSNRAGNLVGVPGRDEEALAEALRAVEVDPNFAHAHSVLGSVYVEAKDYDKAVASYDESLRLDPNLANSYSGLGSLYFYLAKYDESIKAYNRTIELAPNLSSAHNGLANVYLMQGNYDEAEKSYHRAIGLAGSNGPDLTYPHNGLGVAYYQQGKLEEAAAELKTAIKWAPTSPYPVENLGQIRLHRNQVDKAKADFEAALKLNPKSHTIRLHLGYALALKGDHAAARKLWQEASDICVGESLSDVLYSAFYKVVLGKEDGLAEVQKVIEERKPTLGLLRGFLDDAELLAKSPASPAGAEPLLKFVRAEEAKLKPQASA